MKFNISILTYHKPIPYGLLYPTDVLSPCSMALLCPRMNDTAFPAGSAALVLSMESSRQ